MERFELKEEHLKLLQNANIRWDSCEFGAPSIDCKRPYGNSSPLHDMREILEDDGNKCPDCGHIFSKGKYTNEDLIKLHKELQTSLRIILKKQNFCVGLYEADDYQDNWKLVE